MSTELQVPLWEWWIVAYFFLGGVAGGAYFISAVIELVGAPEDRPAARMGYFIAFPLVLICAVLLIIDLGRPDRFWHMVVYAPNFLPWINWVSPMSVGAIALLLFGVFAFLSFVDALVEIGKLPWAPLRERYSGSPRMVYAVIGALFGFFITAYTGELLATSQFPVWTDTPLLGAMFAASGAASGLAAITLGLVLSRTRLGMTRLGMTMRKLRQTDIVAMILEILLLALFLILLGRTAQPLFTGLSGVLLIGGVIILGLLVPLVLWIVSARTGERYRTLTIFNALLILLGGLLFRTVIVMGGQGLL